MKKLLALVMCEYFDVTSEGSYRILVDYSYSDEQGGSGSTYAIFEKAN